MIDYCGIFKRLDKQREDMIKDVCQVLDEECGKYSDPVVKKIVDVLVKYNKQARYEMSSYI